MTSQGHIARLSHYRSGSEITLKRKVVNIRDIDYERMCTIFKSIQCLLFSHELVLSNKSCCKTVSAGHAYHKVHV